MTTSTDTYEHTINGLLQKRTQILQEMAVVRERLATMANDVSAIDRVLETLGHGEKLQPPPAPRNVVFYRGQLREWVINQLRTRGPASTRALSKRLLEIQEHDPLDKHLLQDTMSRVGRALYGLHAQHMVRPEGGKKLRDKLWRFTEA